MTFGIELHLSKERFPIHRAREKLGQPWRICMQPTELLRGAPALVLNPRAFGSDRVEDRQLAAIACGFQSRGGLATADEVALVIPRHSAQPISALARWIVDRDLVHFAWQGAPLLPLFQFDRYRMLM